MYDFLGIVICYLVCYLLRWNIIKGIILNLPGINKDRFRRIFEIGDIKDPYLRYCESTAALTNKEKDELCREEINEIKKLEPMIKFFKNILKDQ